MPKIGKSTRRNQRGRKSFDLKQKLTCDNFKYAVEHVEECHYLTIVRFQRQQFVNPLMFKSAERLGMFSPGVYRRMNEFLSILQLIQRNLGSNKILNETSAAYRLTAINGQRYFEEGNKRYITPLEFRHSTLDQYVNKPITVRQIDWADCVWPKQLKESFNGPNMDKFLLMCAKGCYSDFHINAGGSSLWYNILRGSQTFWLIPPTEDNLKLYEHWVISGRPSDVFFGDLVEKCSRITLLEDETFLIPSGWIMAVYSPEDTVVIGGNFLHSYAIVEQIRIARLEEATNVPQEYRYPFFTEMLWFLLARYAHAIRGNFHIDCIPEIEYKEGYVYLNPAEIRGLKEVIQYLETLPRNRQNIPNEIIDPVALINDVKLIIRDHENDNPEFSVTIFPAIRNLYHQPRIVSSSGNRRPR